MHSSWLRALLLIGVLGMFVALVQYNVIAVAFAKLGLSRANFPGKTCARCSACGKPRSRAR